MADVAASKPGQESSKPIQQEATEIEENPLEPIVGGLSSGIELVSFRIETIADIAERFGRGADESTRGRGTMSELSVIRTGGRLQDVGEHPTQHPAKSCTHDFEQSEIPTFEVSAGDCRSYPGNSSDDPMSLPVH